jgi:hypothetical protein
MKAASLRDAERRLKAALRLTIQLYVNLDVFKCPPCLVQILSLTWIAVDLNDAPVTETFQEHADSAIGW